MAARPGLRRAASVMFLGCALVACSEDDDEAGRGTTSPAAATSSVPVATAPATSGPTTSSGSSGDSPSPTTGAPASPTTAAPASPTSAVPPIASECPFMAAEEISAIMDEDLVLPPAAVAIDPVGRSGASCGFVNPTADYMVTIIIYDEKVPGAVADEIASHRENDVTFVDVDNLGTRAIATGGAGALSLAAEADDWYLIVSVVSPPAPGVDPFTPDSDLLDKAAELARAVVQ